MRLRDQTLHTYTAAHAGMTDQSSLGISETETSRMVVDCRASYMSFPLLRISLVREAREA